MRPPTAAWPAYLATALLLSACSAAHKAAIKGDAKKVLGYPIATLDECRLCASGFRSSALGCAAAGGHVDLVKALLAKGAKPTNCLGSAWGAGMVSPLGAAASSLEIMRVLLDAGADPSFFDGIYCPLHYAGNNEAAVRLLLDAGADPGCKDAVSGKTPLDFAQRSGSSKVADMLRTAADPAARARLQAQARYEKDKGAIDAAERAGDAAAKGGRAAQALKRYVEAYRACPEEQPAKERLLGKVFDVARLMSPPPAVPEAAREHAEQAEAYLKVAKDERGFAKAAAELEAALDDAPWWAEARYNLGLTREKAGDLAGAERELKLYLKAAPGAPEAPDVRRKIMELKAARELK